jgi:hypothetical protein
MKNLRQLVFFASICICKLTPIGGNEHRENVLDYHTNTVKLTPQQNLLPTFLSVEPINDNLGFVP